MNRSRSDDERRWTTSQVKWCHRHRRITCRRRCRGPDFIYLAFVLRFSAITRLSASNRSVDIMVCKDLMRTHGFFCQSTKITSLSTSRRTTHMDLDVHIMVVNRNEYLMNKSSKWSYIVYIRVLRGTTHNVCSSPPYFCFCFPEIGPTCEF